MFDAVKIILSCYLKTRKKFIFKIILFFAFIRFKNDFIFISMDINSNGFHLCL